MPWFIFFVSFWHKGVFHISFTISVLFEGVLSVFLLLRFRDSCMMNIEYVVTVPKKKKKSDR